MTVVEEIARAMASADGYAGFDELMPYLQGRYRLMALAALKAMREPTEGMVKAGLEHAWDEDMAITVDGSFRAMIDAAIAEHEGRE